MTKSLQRRKSKGPRIIISGLVAKMLSSHDILSSAIDAAVQFQKLGCGTSIGAALKVTAYLLGWTQ